MRKAQHAQYWMNAGRALALAVTLVAVMEWTAQPAHQAPASTLPAFTSEGVAVNDNVSTYANFDGSGHSLSAIALAAAGFRSGAIFTTHGVAFQAPHLSEGAPDNWTSPRATPITIPITAPAGSSVAFLGASTNGPSSGVATLTFTDKTTRTFTLTLSDWTLNAGQSTPSAGNGVAIKTSYQALTNSFTRSVTSYLFFVAPVTVPAGKSLASVTLPATVNQGILHVFSVAAFDPAPPFNNEGVSPTDGATTTANFDGGGYSYSNVALSAVGYAPRVKVTVNGIPFIWPAIAAGVKDNWSQAGQIIPLPAASSSALGFLGAATNGPSSGSARITYTDGTTQSFTLAFSDWTLNGGADTLLSGNVVAARTSYRDSQSGGKQAASTYVFFTEVQLPTDKIPLSVQLPSTVDTGRLHVFAAGTAPAPAPNQLPIGNPPISDAGAWTGYLHDSGRSGYNAAETALTLSTYPSLTKAWTVTAGGAVSDQPAVVNGVSYWGSWDGLLHATSASGASLWTVNLGTTTDSACEPPTAGVASSPSVGMINGMPAVFVAGGDSRFYAVNAVTGAILWSTSLGTSPSHFLWSSPLVYHGSVYMGVSSFGDCPLVPGAVVKLNANTGAVQRVFHTTPFGCTGVSVWGSVAIDPAIGDIYFATGNSGSCASPEPLAESVVALRASDLSLAGSWQIPNQATGGDIDFGSTPTLFSATINGQARSLLGVVNKDGIYYTFDRTNIAAGPVWSVSIGDGGDCPQCGAADIAPSAFDGSQLYVASGNTTINNVPCQGSVRALDPATGAVRWQVCLGVGPVLAALTVTPGVVIATAGNQALAFNAATGAQIWSYTDTTSGALFYGAAVVSNGRLYVGNMDGSFFAFGLAGSAIHKAPAERHGKAPASRA